MPRPRQEDYDITDEDIVEIERRTKARESAFWPWFAVFGIVGWLIVAIAYQDPCCAGLLAGLTLGSIAGAISSSVYSSRLHNLPAFGRVQAYKQAMQAYESWFVRTQLQFWTSLSGKEFEFELGALYQRRGYDVEIVGGAGDEGVDIILRRSGRTTIVQCKAHRQRIGPSVARELYGTLMASDADDAILASVSGFTDGVWQFVDGANLEKPIRLVSLSDIIEMQRSLDL